MKYTLKIEKDASGVTYKYNLLNEKDETVIMSDDYESPEALIKDLTDLNEALTGGLKNIVKE